MKPEEQVRADFEAWYVQHFTEQTGKRDFTVEMMQSMRTTFGDYRDHSYIHGTWIGYRAAYAQARREALEGAAESLRKQWEAESALRDSKPGNSYHEGAADALDVAEHVMRDLIKD